MSNQEWKNFYLKNSYLRYQESSEMEDSDIGISCSSIDESNTNLRSNPTVQTTTN